jgi:hypothetical protein
VRIAPPYKHRPARETLTIVLLAHRAAELSCGVRRLKPMSCSPAATRVPRHRCIVSTVSALMGSRRRAFPRRRSRRASSSLSPLETLQGQEVGAQRQEFLYSCPARWWEADI